MRFRNRWELYKELKNTRNYLLTEWLKIKEEAKIIKKFKAHGFECLICVIRNWYTAYVGIPKGHPFYKKDYEYINQFVSVHGGLTFSEKRVLDYEKKGIWWIGFDCAHLGDVCVGKHIPSSPSRKELKDLEKKYKPFFKKWTLKDVEKEVRHLAKQLVLKNLLIENI